MMLSTCISKMSDPENFATLGAPGRPSKSFASLCLCFKQRGLASLSVFESWAEG